MKAIFPICVLASLSLWCVSNGPARAQAPEGQAAAIPGAPVPADAAGSAGMEVLTRGPIHEAYAQPVNTGAVTPLAVTKKPPEPIEETPPDAKPADENAVWIGGYWSWDDERKDFLWVSGVWRVPPPGSRWISGYWTAAAGSHQWVPGLWSPVANQEVEYFPEPPASVEQGPTSEPPSVDYLWIPGCWQWQETRYLWRPGYWGFAQPGWVWVPASYNWCPRGWVFCDGYWDYPLARRGLIFAPVYFPAAAYVRPGFVYAPTVVIDPGLLTFYLFVRPTYCHYYFGDYYAASYVGLGIYPWFAIHSHRDFVYDPLFTYYRWHYSSRDPQWLDNLRGWHHYYREHPDMRPPHTLAAQQQIAAKVGDRADRKYLLAADTVTNLRQKPDAPIKLATVAADQKVKIQDTNRKLQQFRTERLQLETKGPIAGTPGAAATSAGAHVTSLKKPQKLRLPETASTLGLQSSTTGRVTSGKFTPSGARAAAGAAAGAATAGSDASTGTRKAGGKAQFDINKAGDKVQSDINAGVGPGRGRSGGNVRSYSGSLPQGQTLPGGRLPGGQQLQLPPPPPPPPPSGSTGGASKGTSKQGTVARPPRTESFSPGSSRGRSDGSSRDRLDRKDNRDRGGDR